MTEPRTYTIPDSAIAELTERFDKIAKRAARLGVVAPTFTIVATHEQPELDEDDEPTGRTLRVHDVTVQGEAPKYAGWSMLAVIDRDLEEPDSPNVVHALGDAHVIDVWRSIGDYCDHCNPPSIARGRKTLVVVRHDDGTEKVVGTTCLRDFLGHASPERIAAWVEYLATLGDMVESFGGGGRAGIEYRYAPEGYLAVVGACIDAFGWVTRKVARDEGGESTSDIAAFFCDRHGKAREVYGDISVTDKHREAATNAIVWALDLDYAELCRQADRGNDYLLNIQAVAHKAGWRAKDLGLGASILTAYQREVERHIENELANENAEPCPTGRITITGTVLGTRVDEGYMGGPQLKLRVRDDRGFVVYGTSPSAFDSYTKWDAGPVAGYAVLFNGSRIGSYFATEAEAQREAAERLEKAGGEKPADRDGNGVHYTVEPVREAVSVRGVEQGDRVQFAAAVEPKRGETHFGYYKRPTKAVRLWEQEAPA